MGDQKMKMEKFEDLLSNGILDAAWEGPHCMCVRKQNVEMDGKTFLGMLIQSSSLKNQILVLDLDELFRRYLSGTPLSEIVNLGLKMLNLPLIGNSKMAELPKEVCYLSKAA